MQLIIQSINFIKSFKTFYFFLSQFCLYGNVSILSKLNYLYFSFIILFLNFCICKVSSNTSLPFLLLCTPVLEMVMRILPFVFGVTLMVHEHGVGRGGSLWSSWLEFYAMEPLPKE